MSAVDVPLFALPRRTWAQARVGDQVSAWTLLGGRRELVCTVIELVQVPGGKEWIAALQPVDGSPAMHAWVPWKDRLEVAP